MADLYIMTGVPGVGKTTWIKEHINPFHDLHVSRDEIRFGMLKDGEPYFKHEKKVFSKFIAFIKFGLGAGRDVYADATHLTKASRAKLKNSIPKQLYKNVHCIYIKDDLEAILERNRQRSGRALVPDDQVISMFAKLETPTEKEGFGNIIVIDKSEGEGK